MNIVEVSVQLNPFDWGLVAASARAAGYDEVADRIGEQVEELILLDFDVDDEPEEAE